METGLTVITNTRGDRKTKQGCKYLNFIAAIKKAVTRRFAQRQGGRSNKRPPCAKHEKLPFLRTTNINADTGQVFLLIKI